VRFNQMITNQVLGSVLRLIGRHFGWEQPPSSPFFILSPDGPHGICRAASRSARMAALPILLKHPAAVGR
jgi:hypothetical protein